MMEIQQIHENEQIPNFHTNAIQTVCVNLKGHTEKILFVTSKWAEFCKKKKKGHTHKS